MTDLQVAPDETEDDDCDVHYVCCVNYDLALCGEDLSDEEWGDYGDTPTTCVECDLVLMNSRCPMIGVCPNHE